jgi:hypothetical protein
MGHPHYNQRRTKAWDRSYFRDIRAEVSAQQDRWQAIADRLTKIEENICYAQKAGRRRPVLSKSDADFVRKIPLGWPAGGPSHDAFNRHIRRLRDACIARARRLLILSQLHYRS